MKYRVKKRSQLLYPDGTLRGEAGYIVNTDLAHDRDVLSSQGSVLERTGRSAKTSPVLMSRMEVSEPKKAKKKTTKKKATKKKD
jgi:hypothetical protein